jgi:N-acetyl-anhydromuramyl-L-alanine amidase AmpD
VLKKLNTKISCKLAKEVTQKTLHDRYLMDTCYSNIAKYKNLKFLLDFYTISKNFDSNFTLLENKINEL